MMMHVGSSPTNYFSGQSTIHSAANNSGVDQSFAQYNQPAIFTSVDSGAGFVVMQQPMMQQPNYNGAASPGAFVDCQNVGNVPMMWPMIPMCNTTMGQEVQWQGEGRTGPAANMTVMVPQPQSQSAPQPLQFAQNMSQHGGFVWMQPVPSWPASNIHEGMQAAEDEFKSEAQPVENQQCSVASGARRQRRQRQLLKKRMGQANPKDAARYSTEELRFAVENTQGACQIIVHGASGKLSSAASEDGASTGCSSSKLNWADAIEQESPPGSPEKLPLSWGDFRDENPLESSQQFPTHANASEQVNKKEEAGDDSLCPAAAVDPVLLSLQNVDGETFRATLDEVVSSVWWLAWTKRGSRIVQEAVEVGNIEDHKQIVGQLHGHVLEALKSPHANHVLQKCIEVMSPDQLQFAITEIQPELSFAARHRFGCRILQRLIEHGHPGQTEALISELVADAARLCKHQFGNFTIQHVIQHGSAAHRSAIARMLSQDTIRLAKHRIASYTISCALSHCAAEDVKMLTHVVLHDSAQLADLSRRQYGSFVVREAHKAARLHAN